MSKGGFYILAATAVYALLRYLIMRFIVTPITAKANARAAKEAFFAKQRSIAEEFDRLNKEIADAKVHYDRAKRDAMPVKPDSEG
jgi:hypothetical protein